MGKPAVARLVQKEGVKGHISTHGMPIHYAEVVEATSYRFKAALKAAEHSTVCTCRQSPCRGREVVAWLDDDRVDFAQADVFQPDQTADLMRDYDLVMDGTPISINHESTLCIARAGVHGVNLNGTGPEFAFHDAFVEAGKTYVPGFGMTPGITNVMSRYAHDRLESIRSEERRVGKECRSRWSPEH